MVVCGGVEPRARTSDIVGSRGFELMRGIPIAWHFDTTNSCSWEAVLRSGIRVF
jgi:hypothetical protein